MTTTQNLDKLAEIDRLEMLAQTIGDKAAKRDEPEDGFYTLLMIETLDKADQIKATL